MPARSTRGSATLELPPKDPTLQAALESVLAQPPFNRPIQRKRMSVVLVDLSEPDVIRYAGVDEDRMRYAASLAKIAIMLTVFEQVERGNLEYTPTLTHQLEGMIRRSENRTASALIKLVGFETIERTLRDPRYELYTRKRGGGLWVGKGYGGLGVWRRDPLHKISHGVTARQVARFLIMLERGTLVSPWASQEMKRIMGHPEIDHKFVLGLSDQSDATIYRKSGTYKDTHADAAIIEHRGKTYVAVALLQSPRWRGVLPALIGELDELVIGTADPSNVGF